MNVYLLQHRRPLYEDVEDVKSLGIYASHENASAAEQRYRRLPGFREWPDAFSIDEWELDRDDQWTDGFVTPEPE